MREKAKHIIAVLLLLSGLVSCRKEVSRENDGNSSLGDGSFTARIDGVNWTASDSAKGAALLGGQINITGISADNKQLSITLSDTIPGLYYVNQLTVSLAAYQANDSSDVYAFTSDQGADTSQAGGSVTVTEIDKVNKTISGTFAFKLYREIDGRQRVVTAGVFHKLPYISELPPASGTDTLQATIDGTPWKALSIIASQFSGQITINGSDLNANQSVGLIMPLSAQPGTYPLDYTTFMYFGIYKPLNGSSQASASGSITILENDPTTRRVRGNFDFKAVNPQSGTDPTHQLSNGYFSVQYN